MRQIINIFLVISIVFSSWVGCTSDIKQEPKEEQADQEVVGETPTSMDSIHWKWSDFDETQTVFCRFGTEHQKIAVRINDKWGIIDENFLPLFPIEFDKVISNQQSVLLKKDGKYFLFDHQKQQQAILDFDSISPILPNLYLAQKEDKFALLEGDGKSITAFRFEQITVPKDQSYFIGKEKGKPWKPFDRSGQSIMSENPIAVQATKWLNDYRVTLYGFGPIRLGMSTSELEEVIGLKLVDGYEGEFCRMYSLREDFLSLQFMFNKKKGKDFTLERIYFSDPGILTKSGVGAGSTASLLTTKYGKKLLREPNKYVPEASDIFYVPTDKKDKDYRLNFFCDKGKIEFYSVGRIPSIFYVEHCL